MSSGSRAHPALCLVIPAYRAAAAIAGVVARAHGAAPGAAVIVVDDGSDDATACAADAAGAEVLRHPTNHGKGQAIASGIAAALDAGAEVIVTLDADGQHPPEAVPLLVEPVAAGRWDLVVGARARDARQMPVSRQLSNWLSSALLSRAVGFSVPDSQSGFRAMRREVAESVRPVGARYDYETEFLFLAAHSGFRIGAVIVPTVYNGARSYFRCGADTLAIASVYLRHWRSILLGPESR